MKKILIAGGTGFIGQKAAKTLANAGNICYILTRQDKKNTQNIYHIKNDLNTFDEKYFIKMQNKYGNFDAAIYMAANILTVNQKKETYIDAVYSTLMPTINFSQVIAPYIKQIVFTSSIDVVGIPKKYLYSENTDKQPITPYAASKLAGEVYLKSIAEQYCQNLTILRFSQVYGYDEPIVRIIPILLNAIQRNTIFNLYGEGKEKRRFLYLDDAVEAVSLAI
jgi:UDP-glucose 4-epimerase